MKNEISLKEYMDPVTSSTDIAIINNNIGYIQKDIANINLNIKELAGVYATKIFVDDSFKGLDIRTSQLEKSSNMWKWLSPSLAAVLGSILTYLILAFISSSASTHFPIH